MAGEIVKTRAVCLAIRPWSRTSHVVTWLTPSGCVTTLVKGAVRPKSAFLGQYDFNYTCEMLYYARAKGELHALRECTPLERRDALREDYRAVALSDWYRHIAATLAPTGPEAAAWLALMEEALDALTVRGGARGREHYLRRLAVYDLAVLRLAGLSLEFGEENGAFYLRGMRNLPVSAEVMAYLGNPGLEKNLKIVVEAARLISVYYSLHLDCAAEVRRTVLRMIYR